jgi:hypothetical protein
MNKTDRKNKKNLVVKWPETNKLFTLKDLIAMNSDFVEITLRTRLDKAIKKEKSVTIIGYKNTGKGRPVMILAMNPVTQEFIDAAYASDEKIQPPETKPIASTIDSTTPVCTTTDISTTDVSTSSDIETTHALSA